MKGKWAQGLQPRAFIWVVTERLAASERPGGYARNHRKVRRDEELIWLRQQGFTHVLSLLDSPHNLAAYEEAGIPYAHVPLGRPGHEDENLSEIYEVLKGWFADPDEKVLMHHEEFGDRLAGVIGGFLLSAGFIEGEPTAVALAERLTGRQLGPAGRAIVRTTIEEGLAVPVAPGSSRLRSIPSGAGSDEDDTTSESADSDGASKKQQKSTRRRTSKSKGSSSSKKRSTAKNARK